MIAALIYYLNAGICLLNLAYFIVLGSPLNFVSALACGVSWAMIYADPSVLLQHSGGDHEQ